MYSINDEDTIIMTETGEPLSCRKFPENICQSHVENKQNNIITKIES